MSKRTNLTLLFVLVLCSFVIASAHARLSPSAFYARFGHSLATASDREQDGLAGPVRRVKTETAKISVKNGKPVEGARVVLETTTYDQRGTRIDNAYFLAAGGTLTGKEVYKYDDKGNMVEMTLYNDDGSLQAKEVYTYEFDAVGNWVKMTTAVAIIEGGKITFEPSEVTYRTISYFLDESMMAKMSQPASQATTQTPAQSSPAPANSNAFVSPNAQSNAVASQPVSKPSTTASVPASKPAANPVSNPVSNSASQPASQSASKPAERAKSTPVVLASLDKTSLPSAGLPAASVSASSASSEGGPAVNSEGEAPAARPVVRGPLKPVSGGILNGKAINLPAPSYPEVAKRMHTMGLVEVEVIIDINGKVISAKAVKGPTLLMQAAEQAAKQAKFTPTLLSGQPVKISGIITYNFSLQ
jgi:periplasmic protein TonB